MTLESFAEKQALFARRGAGQEQFQMCMTCDAIEIAAAKDQI